jgi:hypothetical protein
MQIPLLQNSAEALWQWLTAAVLFSARIKSDAALKAMRALLAGELSSPEALRSSGRERCRRILHDSGYDLYGVWGLGGQWKGAEGWGWGWGGVRMEWGGGLHSLMLS